MKYRSQLHLGAAALLLTSMALAGCSNGSHPTSAPTTSTTAGTTTLPPTTAPAPKCPLTGAPAPGGSVPQRAALAVKVENLPQARPQYGLDSADVVYEEPVEGGITRFVAIYQCQDASRIEPVRSGRLVDPDILAPMGKMLFAYSGAIQPVITKIDAVSPLQDVGVNRVPDAYQRDSSRYAPHNLKTSTSSLYQAAAAKGDTTTPPAPLFTYGPMNPTAKPAASTFIDYSYSPVTWTWDTTSSTWKRSYSDTGKALQGDGVQLAAANVIVMHVVEYPTQYVEDATGVHENELVLTGSGAAEIYRNGAEITGKWQRPALGDLTTYTASDGSQVNLAPGNTWVELVPTTVSTSSTP